MKRYFNTSGPNIVEEHYTLLRSELVAEGLDMVQRNRYFTIWAPRQTGKSTYFLLLKKQLEERNYQVIHMNLENYLGASLKGLLNILIGRFQESGYNLSNINTLDDFSEQIYNIKDGKCVLIIDEIEGLNPKLFGQFLHSIRNLYHFRAKHCLKSVILVGVSNIVGVVQDNASPFNIADNLPIPYFTNEETIELLGQHEQETGQLFEPAVKQKISEVTANQPGLVNGFAQMLITKFKHKNIITYNNYLKIEDWYLRMAIDKNIENIISKAQKYRNFVEQLLFTQNKIPFIIDRKAIKILHTNGVVKDDGNGFVTFWVPIYKKRLYNAFYPYTNGESADIQRNLIIEEFLLADNSINWNFLINSYKKYVQKRSFKYFREKDEQGNYYSIKEAALMYSFETYIQAFLQQAEGKSYLEAHTGLGRSDLIIYLHKKEYIVESKVYYGATQFRKGKRQLAYYCQKQGLSEGIYLVFVADHLRLPADVKDNCEVIKEISIHTHIIFYDEQKDF